MKFRLKLGPLFELEVQLPEPVQVSTTDLVAALWSAITQVQPIGLISECEDED